MVLHGNTVGTTNFYITFIHYHKFNVSLYYVLCICILYNIINYYVLNLKNLYVNR